jgi:hypothetical protein
MGRCMLFSTEFAPQRRRRQPCDFGAWFCGLYWKGLRVASRTQHQINAKQQHQKRHSHQSACACGGCCGIHANANITRDDGCWQCKKGYKREIVMWQYASCRREKGTKYQDWHATRPTHSLLSALLLKDHLISPDFVHRERNSLEWGSVHTQYQNSWV